MTRLHLVRHGPTHAKTMVGWSDLPADLSDRAAVARLSAHLPGGALVISSDLIRAVDTASAVETGRTRLPHDEALREIHFGDWELRAFAEIEAEDPVRIRAYWEQPGDVRPPNGESWNEVRTRVDTAIDRLIAAHTGRDLIIVAHFGVILTQVQRALQLDAEEAFGHRIDNLSVTELTHSTSGWKVGRINHLP
ncbi:histidine phosphatase family protein [Ruegeria sp. 2205SS24-7]|uniref:histidine phosphatase family protein n=1 Tax=Ruegeria discodermiae TaxID=3064389 RepID=UPI0027407EAC|nr:histidine phosphatase family protein [Ruegeria sp. 2205SS24-7]MDP5217397.1 histidine phosphatase family protein [Ruegeria sp. 2205SS24-7]